MKKRKDYTGQTINGLYVEKDYGLVRKNNRILHYVGIKCKRCGKHLKITTSNLLRKHSGLCRGCSKIIHDESKTRLYHIWQTMKARCAGKTANSERYVSKNITIIDEWKNDFQAFKKWAYMSGYRDDLTIDRRDNSKGYSPNNCRWVNKSAQSANRDKPKHKKYIGVLEIKTKYGIKYKSSLMWRGKVYHIYQGDSMLEAVFKRDIVIYFHHLPHTLNYPDNIDIYRSTIESYVNTNQTDFLKWLYGFNFFE